MTNQLRFVGTILHKDLRLLWPLALLAMVAAILNVAIQGQDLRDMSPLAQMLLPLVSVLTCGFFVVAAIHADPPASIRHDWLTRPVPRSSLFVAKAVLIFVVLFVPSIVGETIASLREGRPWGEIALVASSFQWAAIISFLALSVAAAITSTLIEVAIVIGITLVIAIVLAPLSTALSGTGEEIYASGSAWLAAQPRALFAFVMGAVALWLMYSRRSTKAARYIVVATASVLVISPLLTPWGMVFAIQRRLSPAPAAANGFALERDGSCFPAIVVNPPAEGEAMAESQGPGIRSISARVELAPTLWDERWRRKAGRDAIGFETRMLASGAPRGWRAVIERVDGAYVSADRPLRTLRPARFTPTWKTIDSTTRAASHYWLLPRAAYEELAVAPVQLSLFYSVSLLAPTDTVDIPVDGQRNYLDHFGYCGAQFDPATDSIEVDCFKRGSQPAQFTASLARVATDTETPSDYPDYSPVKFDPIGGKRHVIKLRDVPREDATSVRLTNYEALAHFNRRVLIDGVLGADARGCPAPDLENGAKEQK